MLAIFFIAFYLFINERLTILSARPLIFLGTISYSLYLVHQNFSYVVIKLLEDSGFANSISVIVLPLIASILIAALMQRYIEQPALDRIRRGWKSSGLRGRGVNNHER